jgi:hypothetical protein
MVNLTADGGMVIQPKSGLSARVALELAWVSWVVLLTVPFLVFLAMVWQVAMRQAPVPGHVANDTWFMVASAYLLLAGPASFFWRGHLFAAYSLGKPVAPGKYLFGMLSIWLALEVGGLFSLMGCFVDHAPLPNLIPALVAFMFFVTFWPSGKAMVSSRGHSADPGMYREPS